VFPELLLIGIGLETQIAMLHIKDFYASIGEVLLEDLSLMLSIHT